MSAEGRRAQDALGSRCEPPRGMQKGFTCKEGIWMARNRLRIYYGPDESVLTAEGGSSARQMVTLPLTEVLPLLVEAHRDRRTWLNDFSDDPITISSDLYEVLLAYEHFRRPSA
jgi:hypothetical protein